ncbi:hypothetical protein BDN72DRAFT_420217 [Pluteus cervinus]|uniref:Uncharacterized protein n=1 Tax=Pluteus cervinus TaxID=181527 RepID=A0ACD3A8A1_9AGAR|nr:hypothetical protein BDN72DRAFT_420217 [Pluteus cervinus]
MFTTSYTQIEVFSSIRSRILQIYIFGRPCSSKHSYTLFRTTTRRCTTCCPVEQVGHGFPPCIISFSQFPLLRKLDLYRGVEPFPRTFFRWTLSFLSDLPPANSLQEITFNFPMLTLPVPPVPTSGDQTQSNTEGESQRALREFFLLLLAGPYEERKDALESITEFDALLMDFVNLKTFCVISKAPDTFFHERLPRLNETGRLVLQPPSESSIDVF